MVSLKTKILLLLMIIGLPLCGQSFIYSYIDPCTKQNKFINADMSAPIVISYYGQVKTFTYAELSNGIFDAWINDVYIKYRTTSPCQGVLTTTTTTTSTNQVSNIIGNVTSLLNLDLSSISNGIAGGVGSNVGGTTSSGAKNIKNKNKKDDNNTSNSSNSNNSNNSNETNSNQNGQTTGKNGENTSENQGGSNGSGEGGGSVNGSGSNSGSSGNSSGNSSGGNNDGNSQGQEKDPEKQKIEEQKTETQKQQSQSVTRATSRSKAETQKPAILVTGDIVGVQTTADGSQDARGTMSFTRVKGDGTASIGLTADYMVNAKIGNISAIRSWIGTNKSGHKHINVVSGGIGFLPQSTTANALFVRVNSIKKFTALYGVAGTYGQLYKEELISAIAIAGFMYKGKLTKSLDATIIAAGIYSPYSKFYTESIFEAKPIVIPFLNLNYKLTKTFGVGLTAGGTYVTNQDVLNYQILMGAKLLL